jgi:hypothetical protein
VRLVFADGERGAVVDGAARPARKPAAPPASQGDLF